MTGVEKMETCSSQGNDCEVKCLQPLAGFELGSSLNRKASAGEEQL